MKPRLFAHGGAQTSACPQRPSTMLCEDLRYEIFEISYWGELIQGSLNRRWKKRLKYQGSPSNCFDNTSSSMKEMFVKCCLEMT